MKAEPKSIDIILQNLHTQFNRDNNAVEIDVSSSEDAIRRASGINQHQLSHYATRIKKPRPEQRRRIVEGIHKIGQELMSVV